KMAILDVRDTLSFKMYEIKDPEVSARFDVFKLDLSKMAWVKVESIDDRIFFLGGRSTSARATDFGLKGNCIYVQRQGCTSVDRYDLEDGTTTVPLPCPKKFPHWHTPFWVVPNCNIQMVAWKMIPVEEYCVIPLGISFSAPPTSSDCVICGFAGRFLSLYSKGEDTWREYVYDLPSEFSVSPCNPVFCDGVFYCLGIEGNLAVFNLKDSEEECQRSVLQVPKAFPSSMHSAMRRSIQSFIVEYDGEILSVFVGFRGIPIWIYKLDRLKMKWITLDSLGDKVLFLTHTSSITCKVERGREQDIFPKVPCMERRACSIHYQQTPTVVLGAIVHVKIGRIHVNTCTAPGFNLGKQQK
ncbi:hypothetical protein IFM89_023429, partial [Coptis chinensis]